MTDKEEKAVEQFKYMNEEGCEKCVYEDDKTCVDCFDNHREILLNLIEKQDKIINEILEIAFQYGQIDGEHHKSWVIDQIVRKITGKDYGKWVAHYEYDEETDEEYEWDIGIAP